MNRVAPAEVTCCSLSGCEQLAAAAATNTDNSSIAYNFGTPTSPPPHTITLCHYVLSHVQHEQRVRRTLVYILSVQPPVITQRLCPGIKNAKIFGVLENKQTANTNRVV